MGTVHHAPACSVASTTVPIQEPQPACFCKFLAFFMEDKTKILHFDFLQILILRFDGTGSDGLHTIAFIDDPLHKIDEELALVIKGVRTLEPRLALRHRIAGCLIPRSLCAVVVIPGSIPLSCA